MAGAENEESWRAAEVLNIRGVPSNPVPGAGRDHMIIEVSGSRHAERGEDEHAPALERENCDTLSRVAVSDPTERRMYITRSLIREYGVTE